MVITIVMSTGLLGCDGFVIITVDSTLLYLIVIMYRRVVSLNVGKELNKIHVYQLLDY